MKPIPKAPNVCLQTEVIIPDSGKARFIPISPRLPEQVTDKYFPFVLNTGRIRDQWHTMTRTGKVAELNQHTDKPTLHIHPSDARILKISDGMLVKLTAKHKASDDPEYCLLTACLDKQQRRGELFAPMHWNEEFASHANINRLVAQAVDPISGQPELKSAAVAVSPYEVAQWATVVTRKSIAREKLASGQCYWLKQVMPDGYCYQFAFDKSDANYEQWLRTLIHVEHDLIRLHQPGLSGWLTQSGDEVINSLSWLSTGPIENNLNWFNHLLANGVPDETEMLQALKQEMSEEFSQGRLVCSCFQVRENSIKDAIANGAG